MTIEERVAAIEAQCAACKRRRKRRRRIGFGDNAAVEGTSLTNSISVMEQDRDPDEFDERRRR